MLRNTFARSLGAQRAYSTQPAYSKADIEALLERVKSITAKESSPEAKRMFRKPIKPQQKAQTQKAQTQKSETDQARPQHQRPKKPFQQRSRNEAQLSDFEDVASSFVQKASTSSSPKRANKNTKSSQGRPMLTNKLRDMTSAGARGSTPAPASNQRAQRRQRTPQSRERKGSVVVSQTNPNIQMISTQYTPEVPTLDSLFDDCPLTAQSTESRILKAYRELKANADANVSGVLTGQFAVTSDSAFIGKLKTPALKHNAEVVVSCLNKNSSLDYETKMKLLLPLSGVAPVKQLTA